MKQYPTKDTMQIEQAAHANHGRSQSMTNFHRARRDAMAESQQSPMMTPDTQASEEIRQVKKGSKFQRRY